MNRWIDSYGMDRWTDGRIDGWMDIDNGAGLSNVCVCVRERERERSDLFHKVVVACKICRCDPVTFR